MKSVICNADMLSAVSQCGSWKHPRQQAGMPALHSAGKLLKINHLIMHILQLTMKITALKEKSGAYEFRQNDETIFGGIVINGKNQGVGFVGDAKENRYIFEFEDGMFSKSVKIFFNSKDNPIGKVDLGFTDSGTLKFSDKTYEWQALSSSKVWFDSNKNIVILLDLENNSATAPNVLTLENLDAKTKELLILCGWYLLVIEWRAGLTNANLAGLPIKMEDFIDERKSANFNKYEVTWFDVLVDAIDVAVK